MLMEEARKTLSLGFRIYRAYRNGDLVVVPALGHLYTVAGKRKGQSGYPVFDYEWVPRYLAERKASKIRVWLKVIAELAENAEAFVDACDYDFEGSLIGYCILKYACGGKEQIAKRMKYSTLTTEELQESYANLSPHLDFALVQAGLTRHEVDWLYGINLSRALTVRGEKRQPTIRDAEHWTSAGAYPQILGRTGKSHQFLRPHSLLDRYCQSEH